MRFFFSLRIALDLAINLLRRSHASAGRIHMQNDGLDRRVVAELLQFAHDRLRRRMTPSKIDHADAVAKSGDAGISSPAVQR